MKKRKVYISLVSYTTGNKIRMMALKRIFSSFHIYVPFPISVVLWLLCSFRNIELHYWGSRYSFYTLWKIHIKQCTSSRESLLAVAEEIFLQFVRIEILGEHDCSNRFLSHSVRLSRQASISIGLLHDDGFIDRTIQDRSIEMKIWLVLTASRRILSEIYGIIEKAKFQEIMFQSICHESMNGEFSILEIADANVVRGRLVEKEGFVIPVAPYEIESDFIGLPSHICSKSKSGHMIFLRTKETRELESGVFVNSNPNYYHFTWDIAPRILLSARHVSPLPNVLVPSSLPSQLNQMIESMTGKEPILISPNSSALVRNLLIIQDSRYRTQIDYSDSASHNIFATRNQDLELLKELGSNLENKIESHFPDSIYIPRPKGDLRIPNNNLQVEHVISKMGYKTFRPEYLSFCDQVALFSRAKRLCISAGAAVTNLLYCQNLEKVTLLIIDQTSPASAIFWQDYCRFLELEFECVYARNSLKRNGFGSVDLQELQKCIGVSS